MICLPIRAAAGARMRCNRRGDPLSTRSRGEDSPSVQGTGEQAWKGHGFGFEEEVRGRRGFVVKIKVRKQSLGLDEVKGTPNLEEA